MFQGSSYCSGANKVSLDLPTDLHNADIIATIVMFCHVHVVLVGDVQRYLMHDPALTPTCAASDT